MAQLLVRRGKMEFWKYTVSGSQGYVSVGSFGTMGGSCTQLTQRTELTSARKRNFFIVIKIKKHRIISRILSS
jgi:hypothetical protein